MQPQDTSNTPKPSPSKRAIGMRRAAMLGAVAVVALGAFAAQGTFVGPQPAFALAQTEITAGPASFADVVQSVRGAVVSVKVKMLEKAEEDAGQGQQPPMPHFAPGDPMERFFKQFGPKGPFGGQNGPNSRPRSGIALGSGFIISSDGYIVTNNHVVENATEVSVKLDDGKVLPAKVVGVDKKTDLALLKISTPGTYPHVAMAAQSPRVGDWVIAVGNPFGLGGTVTAGIVSARGRDIGAGPYDDYLQIDAPVNKGNSGGPTFNIKGEVVGVNTAIFSPSGGSVGIGFAIPVEVARDVITSLKDKGQVTRGWIGVQIQPVSAEIADSLGLKSPDGALVAETQKDAPAAKAGLKSGDVITTVNGKSIADPHELARTIAAIAPDSQVSIGYIRDGVTKTADLKLGTLPNDQQAKADFGKEGDSAQLSSFGFTLAPASGVAGAGKVGVVVSDVDPNGIAAQKGLKTGDVILEAGGQNVSTPAEVGKALSEAKSNGRKAVLLRVKSGEGTRFVALAVQKAG